MHETASPRELTIIDLLRVYRDLEGGGGMTGAGGDRGDDRLLYNGGRRTLTGDWVWDGDWDKSGCDALDELLKRLRVERPSQWWHLTERYLRCDSRPRRVRMERSQSGTLRLPAPGAHAEYLGAGVRTADSWTASEQIVVVETWSTQVRREKVRRGVAFLVAHFPWDNFRLKDLTQTLAA